MEISLKDDRESTRWKRKEKWGERKRRKIALTFDGMVDITVTLCPRTAKAFINA